MTAASVKARDDLRSWTSARIRLVVAALAGLVAGLGAALVRGLAGVGADRMGRRRACVLGAGVAGTPASRRRARVPMGKIRAAPHVSPVSCPSSPRASPVSSVSHSAREGDQRRRPTVVWLTCAGCVVTAGPACTRCSACGTHGVLDSSRDRLQPTRRSRLPRLRLPGVHDRDDVPGLRHRPDDPSGSPPALRHALLSYVFGTAIIAVTINVVAGLAY